MKVLLTLLQRKEDNGIPDSKAHLFTTTNLYLNQTSHGQIRFSFILVRHVISQQFEYLSVVIMNYETRKEENDATLYRWFIS